MRSRAAEPTFYQQILSYSCHSFRPRLIRRYPTTSTSELSKYSVQETDTKPLVTHSTVSSSFKAYNVVFTLRWCTADSAGPCGNAYPRSRSYAGSAVTVKIALEFGMRWIWMIVDRQTSLDVCIGWAKHWWSMGGGCWGIDGWRFHRVGACMCWTSE